MPHRTGLTLYAQRLAEGLVRRGHTVTVLTSQYNRQLAREESVNGVRVVRLPAAFMISRGQVMPTYPLAAWRLARENDVVHLHTPLLEVALLSQYATWFKKPVIITHHGDLTLPEGRHNRFIEATTFQLYKWAGAQAFRIVAYSEDYARHSRWLSAFPDKVIAIYPPVDFPISNGARAQEWKHELGLAGNHIVGYAGRFVEEKRPDLLIQAVRQLSARLPNVKLVLAGEYQIRYETFYERCRLLIDAEKEHLVFLGLIRDEERLADFYAMCDVLALPSGTECLGLVQVEAMLNGTPVVVNDTPGAREAVRVTRMGEISNAYDPPTFAAALERVIRNRAAYVKPRERISECYDFERTLDAYEDLYARGRACMERKRR